MAIDGRKRDGRISIEGFLETLMCALGATPALFGDTQLYAKIAEPASAAGDRGFDVSFGDGAADADVHDCVSFVAFRQDKAEAPTASPDRRPSAPERVARPRRRREACGARRGWTDGGGRQEVGAWWSLGQDQFACAGGAQRVNHAFVLDQYAGPASQQILAPDRLVELAGRERGGAIGLGRVGWGGGHVGNL